MVSRIPSPIEGTFSPVKDTQHLLVEMNVALERPVESFKQTCTEIETAEQDLQRLDNEINELNSSISGLNTQNDELLRQKDQFLMTQASLEARRRDLKSKLDEALKLIESGKAKEAQAKELFLEAEKHREESIRLSKSAAQHKENAIHHSAIAAQLRESAAADRASIAERRANNAERAKPLIYKFFFEAFYVKDPASICPTLDHLFSEYLSSDTISLVEIAGKKGLQINDITPFIRFSQANPSIKNCNLTRFTIVDPQPLASYFNSPGCPLKAVRFPAQALQLLAEAQNTEASTSALSASSR